MKNLRCFVSWARLPTDMEFQQRPLKALAESNASFRAEWRSEYCQAIPHTCFCKDTQLFQWGLTIHWSVKQHWAVVENSLRIGLACSLWIVESRQCDLIYMKRLFEKSVAFSNWALLLFSTLSAYLGGTCVFSESGSSLPHTLKTSLSKSSDSADFERLDR